MKIKEQIYKSIVVLVLFSVFMTPTVIKFDHLFKGHKHYKLTCHNHKTESHFHKHHDNCSICNSFFTPLTYELSENIHKVFVATIVKSEENFYFLQFHSFKVTNTQLRAPPIYS